MGAAAEKSSGSYWLTARSWRRDRIGWSNRRAGQHEEPYRQGRRCPLDGAGNRDLVRRRTRWRQEMAWFSRFDIRHDYAATRLVGGMDNNPRLGWQAAYSHPGSGAWESLDAAPDPAVRS